MKLEVRKWKGGGFKPESIEAQILAIKALHVEEDWQYPYFVEGKRKFTSFKYENSKKY